MRVAFIFEDSFERPGGVQLFLNTLAESFGSQGHEVHVLSTGNAPYATSFVHHRVPRTPVFSWNGSELAAALPIGGQSFFSLLRRGHFDVVHLQFPQILALGRKVIRVAPTSTAIVASFSAIPFEASSRTAFRLAGVVQSRVRHRLHRVLPISETAAHSLLQYFGLPGSIVPPPFDPGPGLPPRAIRSRSRIIFIGRLSKRKGCDWLLRSFAGLPASTEPLTLELVGDGRDRRSLEDLAKHLGIRDRVHFRGTTSDLVKRQLLENAAVAVFPSLGGESFGYVLAEAIAAGAPVVAGDIPGYRETLGNLGAYAYPLVEPGNVDHLARAIRATIERDTETRDSLARDYRRRLDQFDPTIISAKFLDVYHSVLNATRNVAASDSPSHPIPKENARAS